MRDPRRLEIELGQPTGPPRHQGQAPEPAMEQVRIVVAVAVEAVVAVVTKEEETRLLFLLLESARSSDPLREREVWRLETRPQSSLVLLARLRNSRAG